MHAWRLGLLAVAAVWAMTAGTAMAEVMVYGPGALEEPLGRVAAAAERAGKPFKLVIGHSPAQARQIADGAPADIFISADPQWMAFLRQKQLLAKEPAVSIGSTRLVLVAPADSPLAYGATAGESLAAALGDGKLAIADPEMIPAGRFARTALEKLGQWDALQGRLAMLEHVRAVALMAERHEVAAGIGFASDVAGDDKLRLVTVFPDQAAPPLDFPMAIVAGHGRDEVQAVAAFIKGPEGAAILGRAGFEPPQDGEKAP